LDFFFCSAFWRHAHTRAILIARNAWAEAMMMKLTVSSNRLMAAMWSPVSPNQMITMQAATMALETTG
jgi:hypothetical protein